MTVTRYGLLDYPGIANLGDTIQALAARRFMPSVDVFVPRERISEAPPEPSCPAVRTILNGWFMHDARFWPPHPSIAPLLISMHFDRGGRRRLSRLRQWPIDRMLIGEGAAYLERWGPVGARDRFTLEQLDRRRIPAYHSGCLTLTLRRPATSVPTDEVVACDLPPAALAHLRGLASEPVATTTHDGGEAMDRPQRFAAAQALLDRYAAAKAVVTTRIHAALPCLAFGTPVLLLHDARTPRRILDLRGLFHSCHIDDFVRDRFDFDLTDPPPNPDDYAALVPGLIDKCEAFVGSPMAEPVSR